MYSIWITLIFQCLLAGSIVLPDQVPMQSAAEGNDLYTTSFAVLEIEDDFYGLRNVSYTVTSTGLAVIDGDVIYGSIEELLAHDSRLSATNGVGTKALSVRRPWPGATISYKFDSQNTENLLQGTVSTAISRWTSVASYLAFTQLPNSATPMNGIVTITSTCGANDCQASVGYDNSPRFINLCSTGCGAGQATHEFGHVLGLQHEHQRPDRENNVHYHCENLDTGCPFLPAGMNCCTPEPGCCLKSHNFDILSGYDASGPYDINSIMHYGRNFFAKPSTDTLIPVTPAVIFPPSRPSSPSSGDFDRICKLFDAWCPRAQFCHSIQCPTSCILIPHCNSPLCTNPNIENPPPCCDSAGNNAECLRQRAVCSQNGCNFLRG